MTNPDTERNVNIDNTFELMIMVSLHSLIAMRKEATTFYKRLADLLLLLY